MSETTFNHARDHFALFELEPDFALDLDALQRSYRELQARYHPDRHAAGDARQQREALQAATQINEAYQTLRDPRLRAAYLLTLANVGFDAERDTLNDPEFLLRQLELREEQEAAEQADDPLAALDGLQRRLRLERDAVIERFVLHYAQGALDTAKSDVLQLSFYDRLLARINERLAALEDALLD